MPADFDACVKGGGKVRTKSLSGGRYMHICIPKGGGPSVAGYVKKKGERERKGKGDQGRKNDE